VYVNNIDFKSLGGAGGGCGVEKVVETVSHYGKGGTMV